jgi:hypothetical protein
MRTEAIIVAVTLVVAPLGAKAADLVVWWDEATTTRRRTRR